MTDLSPKEATSRGRSRYWLASCIGALIWLAVMVGVSFGVVIALAWAQALLQYSARNGQPAKPFPEFYVVETALSIYTAHFAVATLTAGVAAAALATSLPFIAKAPHRSAILGAAAGAVTAFFWIDPIRLYIAFLVQQPDAPTVGLTRFLLSMPGPASALPAEIVLLGALVGGCSAEVIRRLHKSRENTQSDRMPSTN